LVIKINKKYKKLIIQWIQDVSCNKLETLPTEMSRLKKLRVLIARENLLTQLPSGQQANWLDKNFEAIK